MSQYDAKQPVNPVLSPAVAQRAHEKMLRRQQPDLAIGDVFGMPPPEVVAVGVVQPPLPSGVVIPDPRTFGRELAWLRAMVAKHGRTRCPVEVMFSVPMMQAIAYLRGLNRVPSDVWVSRYQVAHAEDRWIDNHQVFAFDWTGLFRDGLHRLCARLRAGHEQKEWLWFGIDPRAFAVMDTGKRRNAQQNLRLDGIKAPDLTATVVRLRFRLEHRGTAPDDGFVHSVGMALGQDDVFQRAVVCAHKATKELGVLVSSAVLAYWVIGAESHWHMRVDEFWDHLCKGTDGRESSPIRVVRNRLIRANQGAGKRRQQYLEQTQQAAWIIMAFNLWVQGLPVPHSQWPRWDHINELPVIDANDRNGVAMLPTRGRGRPPKLAVAAA
jgi:hypothetical protein